MFSCKICEIFKNTYFEEKNTYFEEHLAKTASIYFP